MELEFKKVGSRYEAEFEATGNFNLHIERKKSGGVAIFQKTSADDQYTSESSWSDNAEAVVNKDFSMLIYPKMIKVVSRAEVTKAIVTMAGESGGSGGGLRPITAEDVQLRVYVQDTGGEIPLEFDTEVDVVDYGGKLRIYSEKPLFIGQGTDKPFLYNTTASCWECQISSSYSGMSIVLDIYTQD